MRLHRFITDCDLAHSPVTITDAAMLHQWQKVLRLKSGDRLILCNGKGMESEALLQSMESKHARLELQKPQTVTAEPTRHVTLYCSVLKRENFEWVSQKCTELGLKRIVPIIAERTVKTGLKMDRLRSIAKEAAEQSGRGVIPEISEPMNFASALTEAKNQSNIFYHTNESTTESLKLKAESCNIWVGPEGGWSEDEVQQALEHGFQMSSLGKLVLRAETAAVVSCARQFLDDID